MCVPRRTCMSVSNSWAIITTMGIMICISGACDVDEQQCLQAVQYTTAVKLVAEWEKPAAGETASHCVCVICFDLLSSSSSRPAPLTLLNVNFLTSSPRSSSWRRPIQRGNVSVKTRLLTPLSLRRWGALTLCGRCSFPCRFHCLPVLLPVSFQQFQPLY